MKLTRTPPRDTLQGVCTLLQNVCPELTPERLTSALREYCPNGNGHDNTASRGQLLKIDEAAARLNVHPRTVWNLVSRGKLKKVMVTPRAARIPESAIAEFAANCGFQTGICECPAIVASIGKVGAE